jgi:uncharacterized membrane protein YidH (DUF202 family)
MSSGGLQPERTALAWQRTALAAAVLAVLLVRSGVVDDAPLEIAAGICAAAVVVLCGFAARTAPAGGVSRLRLILVVTVVVAAGLCTSVQLLLRA